MASASGATTAPLTSSTTNSSGPPASVAVMTGLRARKRLERHVAEVLVERHVDDGQRVGVQAQQRLVVDGAEEADAVGDAEPAGQRLEVRALGALAGQHATRSDDRRGPWPRSPGARVSPSPAGRRRARSRRRSRRQPVGQMRRMIQRLGVEAVELPEPARGVARVGVDAAALAEHRRVELEQARAKPDVALEWSKSLNSVPHSS